MAETPTLAQSQTQELPPPVPEAGQVHLWSVALNVDAATLAACRALLAEDERARADRFVFARDRRRFAAARAALRVVLGRYAGVEPHALGFGYGSHGKPFLRGPEGTSPICFNLSHSEELAVIGVARECEIGVDIECHRPVADLRRLAASVFCAEEMAVLDALPAHAQLAAFYAGWTRKEAWIKATGEGFAFPVRQMEVTIAPGEAARIVRLTDRADDEGCARAQIAAFTPAAGFSGAVAVRSGGPFEIACRRFDLAAMASALA